MTEISKTRARQGTTLARLRTMLLISTALAAVALGIVVLVWTA